MWSYDIKFLVSLLYLSTFIMAFIMVVYQHIICVYGAEKASYIWIFTPVIAIFMSIIFEGLLWSKHIFLGMLMVFMGSMLSLVKIPKSKKNRRLEI